MSPSLHTLTATDPCTSDSRTSEALASADGSAGFWLRTSALEVFVATRPVFRVLAVRRPGGASLLADATVCERGLRLAFMEPEQIPTSFGVGNQPADVLALTASSARLRLAAAEGLRYTVDLSLADDCARLRVDLALENVGETVRDVACWSVLSFARGNGGVIVAPFGRAGNARRRLVLPPWTPWPQPGVSFDRDALKADTAVPLRSLAYKVGLISDAGWIAFARGEEALVATAPFDPAATYPEDGANLTFFEGDDGRRVWCEIEQVGALTRIAPGAAARLSHTLELRRLAMPTSAAADVLREGIASNWERSSSSPEDSLT